MIMCQSRPLEPSRTVRVLLADRPQFRHSEHSERQRLWTNLKFEGRTVRTPGTDRPPFTSCNPPETKTSLDKFSQLISGPSAPQGWTVRPLSLKPIRDPTRLWSKNEIACGPSAPQGRTVRAPRADRPQFNFEAHQRDTLSGTTLKQSGGPSAHLGRTVREPTRDFASSLERSQTVRPSCADCPPLLSQPSTLVASQS